MNAERAAAITPSSEQLVSGVTSHSSFGVPLVSIEWQSQSSSIRSQLVRNAMQFPCNSHAISIPFPCHFHIISMRTGGIGIDVKRHGLQSGSEMRNGTDMGQCRKRNSRVRSESEVRLEVGLAGINDSVETPPHLGHRLRIGLVISTDSFIYSSSDGIKFDYWDRSSVKQWIDHLRWWIMEAAGWRRAELGTWNWNGMEWDETHLLMKWNRANRFHLNGWMIDWMRSNERVEWQLS